MIPPRALGTVAAVLVLALGTSPARAGPTEIRRGSPAVSGRTCDGTWKLVKGANVQGTNDDELEDVAAISSTDVWAVGSVFPPTGDTVNTLTEHWDGIAWTVVPSPNPGSLENNLYGVSATSSDDVWAVGAWTPDSARPYTLVEHWDGSTWIVVPTPPIPHLGAGLFGVDAVAPDDVWAVGKTQSQPGDKTEGALIEHWDGTAWSVVPNPKSKAYLGTLESVRAISPTDVWAVGFYRKLHPNVEPTLVEHWDGTSWSLVPSPSPDPGNSLYGLAALSSSDIWAAGAQGSGPVAFTLSEHWDGTAWTVVSTADPGPSDNGFFDVAAVAPDDVWAVGLFVNSGYNHIRTLIEHWDGSSWTVVPSPNPGADGNELFGAAATPAGDVWAVGERPGPLGTGRLTLVEHYC